MKCKKCSSGCACVVSALDPITQSGLTFGGIDVVSLSDPCIQITGNGSTTALTLTPVISGDVGNIVECRTTGLYIAPRPVPTYTTSGTCITGNGTSGNPIRLVVSPDPGNLLSCTVSGLLAILGTATPNPAVSTCITGSGTSGSPITVFVGTNNGLSCISNILTAIAQVGSSVQGNGTQANPLNVRLNPCNILGVGPTGLFTGRHFNDSVKTANLTMVRFTTGVNSVRYDIQGAYTNPFCVPIIVLLGLNIYNGTLNSSTPLGSLVQEATYIQTSLVAPIPPPTTAVLVGTYDNEKVVGLQSMNPVQGFFTQSVGIGQTLFWTVCHFVNAPSANVSSSSYLSETFVQAISAAP
jgi:hypothetical protein